MTDKYILGEDGKTPVACDLMTWAKWMETGKDRHVGHDTIDGVRVSTVFLGLDHSHRPDGPPMLFETMIFGGEHDEYQERCSTWQQAEEMHKTAVEMVKSKKGA